MTVTELDINKIKMICYSYGTYIWVTPFILTPDKANTIYSLAVSFASTCCMIYIMLNFKEALNKYLHSVKMNTTIKYLVYMYVSGYALNILALKDPEGILPYQAILGIGLIALYVAYAISLKNLDAPMERLAKLKYLRLYSNCILISLAMALSIVGVIFFIFLMGMSFFILGNLFVELANLKDDEPLDES